MPGPANDRPAGAAVDKYPTPFSAHVRSADMVAGRCGQVVPFYGRDEFLVETIASFIAPALVGGSRAIVIAPRERCDALQARLRERGLEIDQAAASGTYVTVDPTEMLDAFMIDGRPDGMRFKAALGGILGAAGPGDRRVRVFGEMVSLLWAAGNATAALALEELWHDAARRWDFRLLCG